jgi:1-hydroxycarotenoid 3,4-desaturase
VKAPRVAVIGAGIAGLTAAIDLAAAGARVTVFERQAGPGGKMRPLNVGGRSLDAGPTVFTLRRVFDELFEAAGASLSDHLALRPADVLARHAWPDGSRLDLFADPRRSEDAIGALCGAAEAARYRAFRERAAGIYRTLEQPFMRAARPSAIELARRIGWRRLDVLWRISPFTTLWRALRGHFRDPRLRQLFGRYATYCGSSPFQAPATLMLIAHAEQQGVWLVDGGMHRVAAALAALAAGRGAELRYDAEVAAVAVDRNGGAAGVVLRSGEQVPADAVVVNADPCAVAQGRFGSAPQGAADALPSARRSLSAVTWTLLAETRGFPLLRHTVFFSGDYATEFDDLMRARRVPRDPTVYVCAQDRGDADAPPPRGPEALLCLINAPPDGDARVYGAAAVADCEQRAFGALERAGLTLRRRPEATVVTTPADFERLFPGSGGALYGGATHGWRTSFERPASRSRMRGLYFAGGSVHPGPGVPMAALSGRLAAAAVLADR